ncbi:hypothetical protein A3D85_02400 [Candidatus Amesbacteria bacterium RIFCSPHIGHO2_02_FULL_47_9]|uniref:Uncharacterized protein n=1 Tax=Candidatus Amesbacteria bacterium RIFCSPHIGHO2_01_FULL_48_32b TaxID=1797253 RepID=A0A1F4YDY1_9BACT|nr:MAG: hypothetical protein A2876_03420 [Candidatus Amesbacteria bacterium RIFCSPHIGHO2_01_FULL_48_32b]OGD02318.1 MAG: hypothetical protein A3D85_02400 [Candidatus Amesbacteria bacterium RIFCSPHIGHO2_02_FULL_47_9]OGD08501.1 MAG: hypothetical protein A2899_01760 [Candidatus Amesbacteria bacterium RIFCSPLOWO2_01_FULL_49_25]
MSEFGSYLRKKFDFGASTDVVGLTGNPEHAFQYWAGATNGEFNVGLECIAFSHAMHKITSHRQLPLNIAGFHGRIGTPKNRNHRGISDNVKVSVLQNLIVPTSDLITQALRQANKFGQNYYVLVHNLEMAALPAHSRSQGVKLLPENDVEVGSFQEVKNQKLTADGAVLDVVHMAKEKSNATGQQFNWATDYSQIIQAVEELQPDIIHVSIGADKSDSLPKNVPEEFFISLGVVASGLQAFVLLECQWGATLGSAGCLPHRTPWMRKHASDWVKRFTSLGLLSKRSLVAYSLPDR